MFTSQQFADSTAVTGGSGSSYLHATLERIDQLSNNVFGATDSKRYLVVDTNILLSHLDALQDFVEDVQHLHLSQDVAVVIPGAVIGELDGQKNRDGLAWFARRASAWILSKVRERDVVRGQADEETCKSSENWKKSSPEDYEQEQGLDWGQLNDRLILDCCQYFRNIAGRSVVLCSADNNLCLQCESAGIPSITPSQYFSSREIATTIFSDRGDIHQFRPRFRRNRPAYTNPAGDPPRQSKFHQDEDMGMDIDEEESVVDYSMPGHPLDLLHIQICEHFSTLLVELVTRIGGDEIRQAQTGGAAQSRYAPAWTKNANPLSQWTPSECLEYLNDKKRIKPTSPPIDVFLTKKTANPSTSISAHKANPARRGQDWSTRDWEIALTGLQALGNAWGEGSFQESLAVLAPHLNQVFSQRMRPTGI
ncbi:PIN domain-containing protein [Pleurotus pulmonarius]